MGSWRFGEGIDEEKRRSGVKAQRRREGIGLEGGGVDGVEEAGTGKEEEEIGGGWM